VPGTWCGPCLFLRNGRKIALSIILVYRGEAAFIKETNERIARRTDGG
jgi:hypothetical protein